ncbi:MAG: SIS domain-containing protein [Bryobacterales bacterium]|nr:SIS domain-containing protein [Bryobacterales bacterium]
MLSTADLTGFRFVRDLLEQPQALSDTLDYLETVEFPDNLPGQLSRGRFRRVVLTGMGASYHALVPLYLRLAAHGFAPLLVETSELVHYLPAAVVPDNLVIAVSQSGRSAEMVRLLELAGGNVPVLAVTNTPSSPLAASARYLVELRAGTEAAVSSKTYIASLAALEWLGARLTDSSVDRALHSLRSACDPMRAYLAHWTSHVEWLAAFAEGMDRLFLVGRGRSLSSAGEGGLILKEAARFHAEGMSSAAFRHGPLEIAGPGVAVCVFAGEPPTVHLNRRLADDLLRCGSKAAWIGGDADSGALRIAAPDSATLPLLEILPVQMLALALASRTGHEPGVFRHIAKVTDTE